MLNIKNIKLKSQDIILLLIFIIISIVALLVFKFKGIFIIIPAAILVIIYFNLDNISKKIEKATDKVLNDDIKSKKASTKKSKNKNDDNDDKLEDDILLLLDERKDEDVVKVNKKNKNSKKKNDNKNKKSKAKRSWWKYLLTIIILFGAMGVFAVGGFLVYIVVTTADFNPQALENQENSIVYSADGKEIATLGLELREKVTYDQLPQVLIDAIVATEDSRFFQHNGVDLPRFLKASIGQLSGNDAAGGASTLTMQVVKNNLTDTSRSIIRKFKDMYLATFFMERQYSKEEILEFYVNDSLLGGNVYGVEEASQYYFGKSVSELSLPEAALIAGLYQSPNGYNPYYYPDKANSRIKTVLKLMQRHGYITKEEADIAASIDISTLLVGLNDSNNPYQGYLDAVINEIEDKLDVNPSYTSMKIYTALDTTIQDGINGAFTGQTYTWVNDKVQAGAAVINCNTGEIVAVGAGRKKNGDLRTQNFATDIQMQPGSTAKPIFAYGPALEYANYSPYTLITDEAWAYSDGTPFSNWDNSYRGLMSLRDALAQSRNVPAIKTFQEVNRNVGNKKIVEFVEGLGIDLKDDAAYEAYAIGGLDKGVSPAQMAGAYAAFANGGYYSKPHTVTKIEYRDSGEVVEFNGEHNKVMSDSTAYMMSNMLEYATTNGFSGGARVSGSHVAVKTGTSNFSEETKQKYNMPDNAERDLWSVAFTKNYSVALWYGYEYAKDGYNTTSTYKDNLMSAIMKYIPKETEGWSVPNSVKVVQVEKGTVPAQLPSQYTPADLITTEYFKAGTEPTEVSPRFDKLPAVKNIKATSSGRNVTLTWNDDTPEVLTDNYLNSYFSQSAFGNSGTTYKNDRIAYNNNILGGYGFGIYLEDNSGNLTRVDWTDKKTYTYKATGNAKKLTLVVKSEYRSFKNNASDGVSVDVTVSGGSTSDNGNSALSLNIPNGSSTLYLSSSSVKASDFSITVLYDGEDVTDKATITYSLSGNGISLSKISIDRLIQEIKGLSSGKQYTLTYNVTYDGETITGTQTVQLKN